MVPVRALPRLATRRMRRNWRLLSSVATGTLVASAILATTAIYADAIRDLGLEHAVAARDARELDIRLSQSNVPVNAATHQAALTQQSEAVLTASRGNASPGSSQGTSTTFYPTSAGDQPALADSVRPRGNFVFRTDLLDHIEIVDGAPPAARQQRRDEPIETLIGAATASEQSISVGDVLDMHPFWDAQAAPVRVVVTGIAREVDPTARYWGAVEERLDARERSWPTLRLWIPSESFFGALHQSVPTVAADYLSIFHVTLDELNSRNALDIADGLRTLSVTVNAGSQRTTYAGDLEGLLRSYDEKLFFTQIPLLVLMLQIGAIVAYYLVMVSTMLIERQAAEIATMRSRGATTSQLLAIYGVEGTILAALSAAVGPILAGGVISLLGPTPAFSDLSGGGPLEVHVSTTAYALAMVGALIAFTSLMIPAWRATRNSVVEFKRGVARPSQTPAFMRYYLDVVFVLVVAALFWRLSRQDDLFSETIFGETQVDPILLATPAVFMVTVGVVFLRLFPLVLHGIEWIVGWTRSVAILIGMRSLVRQPSHYARLILLLMFATGVGIFGATFSSTLDQSYRDRAAYEAGADIRALFSASEVGGGDAAARAVIESIPADRVALAARTEGAVYVDRSTSDRFSILAVDGTTFDDIALIRDDFSPQPLDNLGETLTAARPQSIQGPVLPVGAEQIGIWARFPDIRGRMDIQIAMRDATGTVVRRTVASAAPTEDHAEEWRFYAASVTPPIAQQRSGGAGSALAEPVEVVGIFFVGSGRIARQRGVVHLGPLMASRTPPPELTGILQIQTLDAPWPDGEVVTPFSDPAWGVIQAVRLGGLDDVLRPVEDSPRDGVAVVRYEWQDAQSAPGARGIGLRVEADPIPMYLARQNLNALGFRIGDTFSFSVVGRHLIGQVAGVLDYFPTWNVEDSRGFAVADAAHLLQVLNAAAPDRPLLLSEAWFATSDREATLAALADAGIARVIDRSAIEAAQQEDPLIAAGWSGILAVAFASVLLLSALGFVVYSYLTAQQRGLEFAIMRTLGFSRPQVFSLVAFEHLFVIVTGMGLGTLVGLRIGQIMMGFLATDETGAAVMPPFVLGVSWPQVIIVWGILGLVFVGTIAAVVGMYFRLAVHRVLRIGDA